MYRVRFPGWKGRNNEELVSWLQLRTLNFYRMSGYPWPRNVYQNNGHEISQHMVEVLKLKTENRRRLIEALEERQRMQREHRIEMLFALIMVNIDPRIRRALRTADTRQELLMVLFEEVESSIQQIDDHITISVGRIECIHFHVLHLMKL